jgi:hypothetical protein
VTASAIRDGEYRSAISNRAPGSCASSVPDDGYDIPMSARLGAQNAEAILGGVVGDALGETGQYFLG